MMAASPAVIDVLVPLFNESDRMVRHIEEMIRTVQGAGYQPHVILVDDGSSDDTWKAIEALSERCVEVEGVRLSRNFGKDSALFAGLHFTRGDAVITIDSDGQHPIDLIPTLIQSWRGGAMVVHAAKKERRGETLTMRVRAAAFNFLMSKLIDSDQGGASDYKLLDRRMVEILRGHATANAIYRFAVANLGFPSVTVFMSTLPTERPSRWRLSGLMQLAIRALMFHTDIPLKAFVLLMVTTVLLSSGLMGMLLVNLLRGAVPSGYSTLLVLNVLTLCITVVGLTGLAVYLKGAVDMVSGRSGAIVWQQTSTRKQG